MGSFFDFQQGQCFNYAPALAAYLEAQSGWQVESIEVLYGLRTDEYPSTEDCIHCYVKAQTGGKIYYLDSQGIHLEEVVHQRIASWRHDESQITGRDEFHTYSNSYFLETASSGQGTQFLCADSLSLYWNDIESVGGYFDSRAIAAALKHIQSNSSLFQAVIETVS